MPYGFGRVLKKNRVAPDRDAYRELFSEKETMLREEEQHLCTKNQETLLYYPYTPELRQL